MTGSWLFRMNAARMVNAMQTGRRGWTLGLVLGLVLGCHPPPANMRTRVHAPSGVTVPGHALHYAVSVRGREWTVMEPKRAEHHGGHSFTVDYTFHRGPVEVDLQVWADMDDDGEVSEGALVGRFERPFHVESQGPCGPDVSLSPDIVLEPWTPYG